MPIYEALSYTWQDPFANTALAARGVKDTTVILVNGLKLHVTPNLQAAMRRLRQPQQERTFWIDSICINQANNTERTQQVSIMANIYQQASQLTIWLGEEDEKTGMGMTLIVKLSSIRNEIKNHQRLKTLTEDRAKELGIPTFSETSDVSEKWQSVSSILVLQESALAPKSPSPLILCGSYHIAWNVFGAAVDWLMDNFGYYKPRNAQDQLGLTRASTIRTMAVTAGSVGLSTLLEGTQYFSSSLPVDKVFALYGLARDNEATDGTIVLTPDYSKPVKSILYHVAVHLITQSASLGVVLRQVYHGPHRMQGLPSWVPDWTQGNSHVPLDSSISTYRASASETAKPSWSRNLKALQIDGILVDRISRIGSPPLTPIMQYGVDDEGGLGPIHTFKELKNAISSQWQTVKDTPFSYPSGENRFNAFWRTLVANTTRQFQPLTPHDQCHFHSVWKQTDIEDRNSAFYHEYLDACEVCPFADPNVFWHASMRYFTRRFITTSSTLMGLGPPSTVEQDLIYILRGAHTPYVLRRIAKTNQDDHSTQFTLVGEAYVHGAMNGETLNRNRDSDGKIKWQPIELV